jgi:hemerythrin
MSRQLAREAILAAIQWTPDYSVGVESIDNDHKVLISLLNQLDDALRGKEPMEAVRNVLDALLEYTDYHFSREEQLMASANYPDLDAHKRTHATLRAQVADIRDRYVRKPESIHAREVLAFLRNWLTSHIMGRDKLYQPFMSTAAEAVRAAERNFEVRTKGQVPTIAGNAP